MHRLPFSLKVPGKDEFTLSVIATTSFRFRGYLQLEEDALVIEWTGTASVDEVGLAGIRSDRLALPAESLAVPLEALHSCELGGGWIRPYVEITATEPGLLSIVPGEEAGQVRCWIARRDRPLARRLLAALEKGAGPKAG